MQAHLAAMNYDVNKQPLGKLGQSTLTVGYSALKELAEIIEAPDGPKARSLGGFVRISFWEISSLVTLTSLRKTQPIPLPIDTTRSSASSIFWTSHKTESHI